MTEKIKKKVPFRKFIILPHSLWDEERVTKHATFHKYLITIIFTFAVTAIKLYFADYIGDTTPFLLYFGTIIVSAAYAGVGAGALSLLLSVILADFFFISPGYQFGMTVQGEIQLLIFACEGIIIITMAGAIKKIGQKSIQREKRFQSLIEKNNDLIALEDKHGQIIYVSPAIRKILGYTKEDIIGESMLEMIVEADRSRVLNAQKKLLSRKGTSVTTQFRMKHKNGEFRWVEQTATNYLTEPEINAIVINIRDTTDRKMAEEKIKSSEAKFRRLFESDIIGTFISDFDGTFLEANDVLLNMIGYTRQDLKKGKLHRDTVTPPEYAAVSKEAVVALQTTGSTKPYEKMYIHKNGKQIPVLIAVTRLDHMKNICIGFVLDMREQKELEQRKDDFISMASHELKTPITSLKVFIQLLQRQLPANTTVAKYLRRMDEQINRLHLLISDLLDVTKIQAGKLELRREGISVKELISDSVEMMEETYKNHRIEIQGDLKSAIFADYNRMHQVLINLLSNAIKYSPQAKKITVTVQSAKKFVKIAVTDYGVGIEKKYQKKIFDRFFRVYDAHDKTYPGLGMGLYISAEIIRRHGGTIGVKSAPGKGSSFFFSVPTKQLN